MYISAMAGSQEVCPGAQGFSCAGPSATLTVHCQDALRITLFCRPASRTHRREPDKPFLRRDPINRRGQDSRSGVWLQPSPATLCWMHIGTNIIFSIGHATDHSSPHLAHTGLRQREGSCGHPAGIVDHRVQNRPRYQRSFPAI